MLLGGMLDRSGQKKALVLPRCRWIPPPPPSGPFVLVKETKAAREERPAQRSVYVYVNVFSVTEVQTAEEKFAAYFFLRAMWVEPELRRSKDFSEAQAWTPSFQFMNAAEEPNVFDEKVEVCTWRQGRGGEPVVVWSCKVRGSFRMKFELEAFPFDTQKLKVTISSQETGILLFEDSFDGVASKLRKEYTILPEFGIGGPWVCPRDELALGKFATLDVVLVASRRFAFHVWNIFFPVFLLTAMQFSVFAVDVTDAASRLSIALTLVLASVAYKNVVSQNLPNISYLTLCDMYVLGSFVFMAAVVLQDTLVSFWAGESEETLEARDWLCLVAFLVIFVVGHVLYLGAVAFALHRQRKVSASTAD